MSTSICFVPIGGLNFASSRYRVWWPAQHMERVTVSTWEELVKTSQLPTTDVYVFQKTGAVEPFKKLRERGAKVIYDACDPVHWFAPDQMRALTDNVDVLTFATQALADDWLNWYGKDKEYHVIPDRLDLSHYTYRRQHRDVSPVRFIWFGMAQNRAALAGAWDNLNRLHKNGYQVELTIYDDRPGMPIQMSDNGLRVLYAKWNLEQEASMIASHDIALLPPYPGPWGKLKSNNKALTAWACGLPVTDGECYDKLTFLVERYDKRQFDAGMGFNELSINYTSDKTAAQWSEICAS